MPGPRPCELVVDEPDDVVVVPVVDLLAHVRQPREEEDSGEGAHAEVVAQTAEPLAVHLARQHAVADRQSDLVEDGAEALAVTAPWNREQR